MCVCVCIGVGSVEEKTVGVCVYIGVGSVEEKTVSVCVCVLGLGVWRSVCMGTWPDKMKHLFLGVTFIKETPLSFSCLKDST